MRVVLLAMAAPAGCFVAVLGLAVVGKLRIDLNRLAYQSARPSQTCKPVGMYAIPSRSVLSEASFPLANASSRSVRAPSFGSVARCSASRCLRRKAVRVAKAEFCSHEVCQLISQ